MYCEIHKVVFISFLWEDDSSTNEVEFQSLLKPGVGVVERHCTFKYWASACISCLLAFVSALSLAHLWPVTSSLPVKLIPSLAHGGSFCSLWLFSKKKKTRRKTSSSVYFWTIFVIFLSLLQHGRKLGIIILHQIFLQSWFLKPLIPMEKKPHSVLK